VDRRSEIVRRLFPFWGSIVAAALGAAACSSAPDAGRIAEQQSGIRALRWVAKDADAVAFLTRQPVACESAAEPSPAAERRRRGKLAFESPALLGGSAARMGLSCSSCHLNGRGNPDFFVQGVSGESGTADVTSSIFSKVRGDGAFNPVVIPDLAKKDGKQIKDRKSQAFRDKVRGLIVEEFDGQAPPPQVFDEVLAYLDGLDVAACEDATGVEQHGQREDMSAAMTAAAYAGAEGTPPEVALFYLRVARERIERLHERFAGDGWDLSLVRLDLVEMSRQLGVMADGIRSGKTPASTITYGEWMDVAGRLDRLERRSLYNPAVLKAALTNGSLITP
jgi:hypothetical protein